MTPFTEPNWLETLVSVYSLARTDANYRALCLSSPLAAIAQVSDIEMPPGLKVQFFDTRGDVVYPFLLPPVAPTDPTDTADTASALVRWATLCTWPTYPPT